MLFSAVDQPLPGDWDANALLEQYIRPIEAYRLATVLKERPRRGDCPQLMALAYETHISQRLRQD